MLFHMFALWDFNLIDKDQIMEVIAIIDVEDETVQGAYHHMHGMQLWVPPGFGSQQRRTSRVQNPVFDA